MRALMPEWYKLDDDTLRQIFVEGIIVLDANILLQLYRLGEEQRTEVLNFLSQEAVRPRVWVPYQVALEFQRNRLTKAREQISSFREIAKKVGEIKNQLASTVQQHVKDKTVSKQITEKFDSLFDEGSNLVESLRATHVTDYDLILKKDPIRDSIDEFLTGAMGVGPKPSVSEIQERTTEAVKNRFPKKIPPGYCDAIGSDRKENPEGDYLIWSEIQAKVTATPSHVLLVTNDMKEDWYLIDDKKGKNRIIGPRPELRSEFSQWVRSPDFQYHQESLDGFLRLAQTFLSANIEESTLETVRSLNDEKMQEYGLLSKLRHPSLRAAYDAVLESSSMDSDAYLCVKEALEMAEGRRDFDKAVAEAALEILQSKHDSSVEQIVDEYTRALKGTRAEIQKRRRRLRTREQYLRWIEEGRTLGGIQQEPEPEQGDE